MVPILGVTAAATAQPETHYGAESLEPVVPKVFDGDLRDIPPARQWQPGDAIKEIPKRRNPPRGPMPPEPPEPRLDPLLEIQEDAFRDVDERTFTSPGLNIAGQGFTGVNPPDPIGDVSPDHYIQMVNSGNGARYTIHDKSTGQIVAGPTRLGSLAEPGDDCYNSLGDPIVLYDSLADRWLLSEFATQSAKKLCVYVSKTADPISGGWFIYEFGTPNFPDYPKYSVWSDGYYVTSNEASGPAVYAIPRARMLLGQPAAMQRFSVPALNGFGFQALTPADLDGETPPPTASPAYFMRHRDDEVHNFGNNDPSQDFVEVWEINVDFANPANSALTGPFNIPVADFDSDLCGLLSFECFAQPTSSVGLDPLREVIMWRLQYRNFGTYETLVGNFVTDVTGEDQGGIRWFELRKTTPGDWELEQQGTYSPDSVNRWMGAIAMDGDGNIALGYNVSDEDNVYPGIRYTGRLLVDSPGTMTQIETTLATGSGANESIRYGDYSAMSIDPSDDCTFWFTGEYNIGVDWSTRIGTFRFDACGKVIGDPSCSGDTVTLDKPIDVDKNCAATVSLTAHQGSRITSRANVVFAAPKITLGPNFAVQRGGTLRAKIQ
jgi:hypothetical protein